VHGAIRYTPTFVLVENAKEVGRIEGYPGDQFSGQGSAIFWTRLRSRSRTLRQRPNPKPSRSLAPYRPALQSCRDDGPRPVRAPAPSRRAAKAAARAPRLRRHAGQRAAGERTAQALSHEVRLMILCFLIEGEKSVGEIEKMLDLRQPAVSQQLARLRADGVVETRRSGKSIYYSLARSEVRDLIGVLHGAFCRPRKAADKFRGRFLPARPHHGSLCY